MAANVRERGQEREKERVLQRGINSTAQGRAGKQMYWAEQLAIDPVLQARFSHSGVAPASSQWGAEVGLTKNWGPVLY